MQCEFHEETTTPEGSTITTCMNEGEVYVGKEYLCWHCAYNKVKAERDRLKEKIGVMEQCGICKHNSGRCPGYADGELPCAGFEHWKALKENADGKG